MKAHRLAALGCVAAVVLGCGGRTPEPESPAPTVVLMSREEVRQALLPRPASLEFEEGEVFLPGLSEETAGGYRWTLTLRPADPPLESPEAYRLFATPEEGFVLEATGQPGRLYGMRTFHQLMAPHEGRPNPVRVPAFHIEDKPAFPWRGFMLDCSRHFMDKDFIKTLLDSMAYYKMNVFHWHLIDNNGWRMEVNAYPLLTEKAAWRPKADGTGLYGGYYSKEDIREIVRHASGLNIKVIPEIEMPGHNTAALYYYPHLTCAGEPFPSGSGGLSHYTAVAGAVPFCAGREETFEFLETVLLETMEMFPSEVIHIGGDERPEGIWSECERCIARMEEEGLADEDELQRWFMNRITDFLAEHDRRAMTWLVSHGDPYNPEGFDDIGNDAILQNWHDTTRLAASEGHEVVNSINTRVYFDYPEFPGMDKPGWMPLLDLEAVYGYMPIPADLDTGHHHRILGGEACLWTETVPDEETAAAHIFPRLFAVADILWYGQEGKDFAEFETRVERQRLPLRSAFGFEFGTPPE